MYSKVDSKLDFVEKEENIVKFWKENDIFKKVQKQNENGKLYSFFEGPPTANGKPHIGHVLTRTIKDVFLRYHTMQGENVTRKGGWDTHGLPVELEVEKTIGSTGKKDIEKYGIDKFLELCKENVWLYKGMWQDFSDRMGYWVDMDNAYITYDKNYMESVWWSLSELFKKGLIYKDYRILPYCPRCGTSLSSSEVAQGYKTLKERSCVASFKALDEENTYYLAWTTTPWTLPSNAGLCMNPEFDYVKIKTEKCCYIMAKGLLNHFFKDDEYTIVYEKKGCEFSGRKYEPLFDYVYEQYKDVAWKVVCDEYVTLTDGTGIVHIAPAFGEDDSNVGKREHLPFIQLVDEEGKLTKECGEFAGYFVKEADKPILIWLDKNGKLFKDLLYEHEYPHCWRCKTPLVYYARSSWFIKTEENKDILIANNQDVTWYPESVGEGRMGGWFRGIRDWDIGRKRYWGTPLPIWICEDCGHMHSVSSIKELKELGNIDDNVEIDLHKSFVDKVEFECPHCHGKMKRTPELIDCWYDSGAMPFAQLHYPFENKDMFEKTYPAEFISEGMDQTRGWFYSLQTINSLLFGKTPYKRCIPLGLVNDEQGRKMSKSLGNVVKPYDMFNKYGTDAVRWYFYISNNTWMSTSFSEGALNDAQRKFMGTLWNVYSFFVLYANIDNFDGSKHSIFTENLSLMDKWIISKFNILVKQVRQKLDNYNPTEPARLISEFVDELSNWYVRRSRERFWANGESEDKNAAFTTLYYILENLSYLISPFVPMLSETIYQNIVRSVNKNSLESVHMHKYPVCDQKLVDEQLCVGMENVLKIVVLGRSARNASNIKNRQPLSKLYISSQRPLALSEQLRDLILDEMNVEELVVKDDLSEFVSYELKPQLKTLGPKYGKQLNAIRTYFANCDANKVVSILKNGQKFIINDVAGDIELEFDDVLISSKNKDGFFSENDGDLTVVLDTIITEELKAKGIIREVVSKIQNSRKDSDFEVVDHILITFNTDDKYMLTILEQFKNEIMRDTLSDGIKFDYADKFEFEIEGKKLKFNLEKVTK